MTKVRKAYKFRLKTNAETDALLHRFCGCSRFLWNKCLAMNLERLEAGHHILWYNEQAHWLRLWKSSEEYAFLKECPSQVLQQKLMDLERAFRDCFDRNQPLKRLPVFKKRGRGDALRFPQGFKVENRRIFLPRIGWVGFYKSREIEGTIKNITVTRRAGNWFASLQVEQDVQIGIHAYPWEVGIDSGVRSFAAFSDGHMIEGPGSFRRHEEALAKEQRKLARKQRGSQNWRKQKEKISGLHHTIANVRMDFLHKLSTRESKNHARVYVERLNIRGMSASAKGNKEEPGRHVRAKAGLNKSILDQGWYEFRRQLAYKLEWRGGSLVEVDARYTSQRCSKCGYTDKDNRRSQAELRCLVCGYEQHADVNAARNILTVGRTGMACGSNRNSGRKQESVRNREEVLPLLV